MVISEVEQVAVCVACNLHIKDRYLFEVTNRKWHCVCLRCTHCKCLLTEKCWFRQNNLYCKDDYYKLFFSCNTCKQAIERDTYVRKTSSMIFHLQCFQCAQCGKVLDSGDHYIVSENKLLCSSHYPNQLLSLSNSKNSLAELITDQEGEIVVKTEQSNLNSSLNTGSIDNPSTGQQFTANATSANQPPFTPSSLSPPTGAALDGLTMCNAQNHPSSSPFLLNRSQQPPISAGSSSLANSSLHHSALDAHHSHHLHGTPDADRLNPQSLSLIDYPSHHQPIGKLANSLAEFEATAPDFYSTQPPSAACYPANPALSAHNPHLLGNLYEHEAMRFYGGPGCIPPAMSAPTPNSPLNEIENHGTGPPNGIVLVGGGARKGRPRKRKQIGLTSSNNTGIDAISAALHEQNLNNLNSSTSSVIPQSLVNSINSGHLQNSNSSNSSTSSSNGNHQRTKRMRTSFKHSQLKMMKLYFGKNQNPDAKDLKALAQDTGLSKRVLQVWFQNQRAKYRRTNPNKGDGQFNQGLPLNQTLLGSPENGSTRQFSTPSPASIISNNSISNNQSATMQCETSLPANHSSALCSNGSSSSLDQYSPSNSISLLRHTPPPSVKAMQQPSSPSMSHLAPSALHFGHHLAGSHPSNGLVVGGMPNRHLTNFSSEQIMSTFQDLY